MAFLLAYPDSRYHRSCRWPSSGRCWTSHGITKREEAFRGWRGSGAKDGHIMLYVNEADAPASNSAIETVNLCLQVQNGRAGVLRELGRMIASGMFKVCAVLMMQK